MNPPYKRASSYFFAKVHAVSIALMLAVTLSFLGSSALPLGIIEAHTTRRTDSTNRGFSSTKTDTAFTKRLDVVKTHVAGSTVAPFVSNVAAQILDAQSLALWYSRCIWILVAIERYRLADD